MAVDMKLQKKFVEDLKKLSLFEDAVKLVEETYKLEVVVNKSKTEFKIKANIGTELFQFVETLMESWLERKKKNQSDNFEDRIKVTKENPLSDISDGHVVWVFWGDQASTLSSAKYENEVKELKLLQSASVVVDCQKKDRLRITCNFETFKDVKSKVENLKLLVASNSNDASQSDGSKGNSSQVQEDKQIQGKDKKGTSVFDLSLDVDNPNKSVTSEARANNSKTLNQSFLMKSEGASGGQNLSSDLEVSDHASNQYSLSSDSKDTIRDDQKLLFCTPIGKMEVFVYKESITNLSGIDAVVNAANEHLNHAAGVAYHISKAAGGDKTSLEKECRDYIKKNKKIDVTKNFTSKAGKMPYKGVIHAVGPIWTEYKVKEQCAEDLCLTIVNVLVEANKRTFSKIALPAISSGIYGVPRRLCAEMYIKGVIDYDKENPKTCVREIHFVDIKTDILQEIRDAYRRWKQNAESLDYKNANSYSSSSEKNSSRQGPSDSQYQKGSKERHTFQLTKKTCVHVYTCSIVEVNDVHAIACAVNSDFSVENRQVAKLIRKQAGQDYAVEFSRELSKIDPKSKTDVLICGAGKLAETQKIDFVIHVKLGKIDKFEDLKKLRHLYIQIFENASQKKMVKIALPLIGAANLRGASAADILFCSQLFVDTLKEVVEARGNEMSVEEVHFVDLDENIISYVVQAFQEKCTSNHVTADEMRGSIRKSVSDKTPARNEKKVSHTPICGDGEAWIKKGQTSQADEKCVYNCGRPGIKMTECSHFFCKLCSAPFKSQCPYCKPVRAERKKMNQTTKEKVSNGGSNTESNKTDKCPICMDVLTNPMCLPCGHEFHADCIKQSQQNQLGCPICGKEMNKSTKGKAPKGGRNTQLEETENCPICMDVLTKPEYLPCGHKFHTDCIKQSLEYKPACPICGTVMGRIIGNQPEGDMFVNIQAVSLSGYEDCDTIEITYEFPGGCQQENHPHPGRQYKGTRRKAFLPNNSEGKKVLKLLEIAFKRKLIFTIGESRTTGKTDIVTWNDIHHKTRIDGGPTNFGYPDKTYLSRVQEELAAKGVTEKDIEEIEVKGCTIS